MHLSLPLIACFAVAFAIGSNDTSNSFGICIGCGLLTMERASYLLLILVLLGIVFGGSKVMSTVGQGIASLNEIIVATSLLLSALAIVIANYMSSPVSSHQAIVASLIGSALALGRAIDYTTVEKIVLSWLISPFGALVLAVVVYWVMEKIFAEMGALKAERIVRALLLLSGSVIAFNTGANELATALGPAVYFGTINVIEAGIIGSVMMFFGARIVNIRVAEAIGKGITALDPFSGFAAQFSAGLTVLLFTFIGMPVSTTFCIVGAITGVGMYKGLRGVRFALLRKIIASWILTPTLALIASYAVVTAFVHLI